MRDIVRRCFHHIFTKALASGFVFQGGCNTKRRPFEKLKLKDVIFAAVTIHCNELKVERPTEASLKHACQNFFKNAADSREGRLKRAATKNTMPVSALPLSCSAHLSQLYSSSSSDEVISYYLEHQMSHLVLKTFKAFLIIFKVYWLCKIYARSDVVV